MRMPLIAMIATLSALASLPALAGPNWDVIHAAEADRYAQQHDATIVLPLDHGPRAHTTQWLNEERESEINSELAADHKAAAAQAKLMKMKNKTAATRVHGNHSIHG